MVCLNKNRKHYDLNFKLMISTSGEWDHDYYCRKEKQLNKKENNIRMAISAIDPKHEFRHYVYDKSEPAVSWKELHEMFVSEVRNY